MLTHDTVSNFIGGVSQQPDKLMFPNQAKELINMFPNPAKGLERRYPTQHIAKLADTLTIHPKIHTIVKEDEKYIVILTGKEDSQTSEPQESIRVFNLDGVEQVVNVEKALLSSYSTNTYNYTYVGRTETPVKGKAGVYLYTFTYTVGAYTVTCSTRRKVSKPATDTYVMPLSVGMALTNTEDGTYFGVITAVNTTNGTVTVKSPTSDNREYSPISYITTDNPLTELDAVTLGDYTFILNKNIVTEMKEDLYPNEHVNSALIFVKQGDYAIDYKIKVDGVEVASKTTSSTAITDIKTNAIANALYTNLVTNLGEEDWDIQIQNSSILLKRVDGGKFSIQGSDSNADRNLYVFSKETDDISNLPTTAPDGFVIKVVGEDVNENDDYYVKFHTSDSSVSFGAGYWQECPSTECTYAIKPETMPHVLVREEDGTFTFKINDWTDRRCGDESSAKTPSFIGNTIQEIFSYKGRLAFLTADKSIYSDTEDVFAFFKKTALTKLDTDPIDINSNSKMVLLKHSLPFNNDLLLFSDTSEFTVTSGDVFSNSTVALDLTMEYPCSSLAKPVNIGGSALFVHNNGNYSGVYEAYIASTYNTAARSVTEQVTSYIPKNVYKIAASILHNMALFLTTEDRESIWVYNCYYNSEQKAQSAWSRWHFPDREILGADFVENYLYMVVQYSDGVYLERIDCSTNQKESVNSALNYLFYIDRKVQLSSGTYDSETNRTTFILPYTVADNDIDKYVVISPEGFETAYIKSNNTISILGNKSTVTYTFGRLYTSTWKLGTVYKRQQTQTGATQVIEGLLMLKDVRISYTDSCYFKVKVNPKYTSRAGSDEEYTDMCYFNIIVANSPSSNGSEYEYTGVVTGTQSAQLGIRNSFSGVFMIPVLARNEEVDIEIINDSYLPSNFLSMEWLGDLCIRGNQN